MNYSYDIAFSLANRSLCLFTGAGFSKQLTNNKAPGWQQLLEEACSYLDKPDNAKKQLTECVSNKLPLEDCAQILELAFLREKKDFREALSNKIKSFSIDVSTARTISEFLQNNQTIKIITTNYDDLIQRFILPGKCNSNHTGKPVTQKDGVLDIYHIHGSVEHPPSIVATTEDYYRFINTPTYFSRKIFTLMAENTTVFLGYALGDPNLKAIIHAFRDSSVGNFGRGNLFYVTRNPVPQYLKDHFEVSFGLFVIDRTSIDGLITDINNALAEATSQIAHAEENLKAVLYSNKKYTDTYIKSSMALRHIVSVAHKTGENLTSTPFYKLISSILERKVSFTNEIGAWQQYSHLAEWLVYIASLINIRGTPLEGQYLTSVKHSMSKMSGSHQLGYSWEAFSIWHENWGNIMFQNRQMISEFVNENLKNDSDALKIVALV